jgi:hypothetical protein
VAQSTASVAEQGAAAVQEPTSQGEISIGIVERLTAIGGRRGDEALGSTPGFRVKAGVRATNDRVGISELLKS